MATPFTIKIEQSAIDDLKRRLEGRDYLTIFLDRIGTTEQNHHICR
jgi:hypothetical protein